MLVQHRDGGWAEYRGETYGVTNIVTVFGERWTWATDDIVARCPYDGPWPPPRKMSRWQCPPELL
jgi:hypothetical protein